MKSYTADAVFFFFRGTLLLLIEIPSSHDCKTFLYTQHIWIPTQIILPCSLVLGVIKLPYISYIFKVEVKANSLHYTM